mgnify:CR=1 FL=1
MFDVITIGDATMDTFLVIQDNNASCSLQKKKRLLCFHYADKIPISKAVQSVGGGAANVATACAKLGLNSALISTLGDDVNGHAILSALKDADVTTKYIRVEKDKETRYAVVLNYHSERTILSHHSNRTYTFPRCSTPSWFYYSSLGGNYVSFQKKFISFLKKNKKTKVAMNPGSYQLKYHMNAVRDMLLYTDLLFINKEEAMCIVGKRMQIKPLLKTLQKKVPLVVITDSTRGSYSYDGQHVFHMPVYPITPLARTGAGDAYASGFLGAIAKKKNVYEAMMWGTANASGVITKFGAQEGLRTTSTITSFIRKYKPIHPGLI